MSGLDMSWKPGRRYIASVVFERGSYYECGEREIDRSLGESEDVTIVAVYWFRSTDGVLHLLQSLGHFNSPIAL